MNRPDLPLAPRPRAGQQRAALRAPASASAFALSLAGLAHRHDGLVLAVARDSHAAQSLEHDLRVFAGEVPVHHFADWETLPYDLFSPHPDIVSQRVAALYALPAARRGVLVVPVASLMQRLPPPAWIAGNTLDLRKGQRLDLDAEKRRLQAAGYRNVPQVLDPGDFAVRGALLDLYPMGADRPYRIELFDDEIDSLRSFDPETQRSDHPVEAVRLLPAREFPMDEASLRRAREALSERFDFDPRRCPLYQDLKEGAAPAGVEYYLPLFFERTASLFDHLAPGALVVVAAGVAEAAEAFWAQTGDRWEQRRHDIERPVLAPAELYLPPEELRAALNRLPRTEVVGRGHPLFEKAAALPELPAPDLPWTRKGEEPGTALRHFVLNYPGRVLLAADSAGRREALLELLATGELRPAVLPGWEAFVAGEARFAVTVAPLEDGFALSGPAPLAVLTERQLFPERAEQSRRRRKAAPCACRASRAWPCTCSRSCCSRPCRGPCRASRRTGRRRRTRPASRPRAAGSLRPWGPRPRRGARTAGP